MYGMVNRFLRESIIDVYGEGKWKSIREKANLETEHFASMEQYPDDVSYSMVVSASEELGVPADELLMLFGERWISYTRDGEYRQLYRMSGGTFVDFLRNLDNLHLNVANVMHELKPPSFKCTDVSDRSLRLHYYSDRPGLTPFVVGLVKGLANHFDTDVEVTVDKLKGENQDHDELIVDFTSSNPEQA